MRQSVQWATSGDEKPIWKCIYFHAQCEEKVSLFHDSGLLRLKSYGTILKMLM